MLKVCIVDDYHVNIFILEEYLKDSYDVISFDNAVSCIEYVKKNIVDVILMDCSMPVMDGYTATRILKKIQPTVKVIAVTANSFDTDIQKCYSSGMEEVLVKPIFKEKLLDIIENKIFSI
jgi:CheY-like chemotaxis protein